MVEILLDSAFSVLKSDLMDALNKGVKSLDEDSWMFEGPRSRINLISNPGSFFIPLFRWYCDIPLNSDSNPLPLLHCFGGCPNLCAFPW